MMMNPNILCPNTLSYEAYTYIPVTVRDIRPIDICDLKSHLKIDFIDPTFDQGGYLQLLIDAAVDVAERYTNRSFINQKWKTFRTYFSDIITLERGQYSTVNTFKYKNLDSTLTSVDTASYYVAIKNPYSQIISAPGYSYPNDIIDQENNIEIEFTCGYGATKESVPASLRLILCQHVVWLYENKGNCPVDEMPPIIKSAYDKHFKILSI